MKLSREHLKKRGWTSEEIEKTLKIIEDAKQKKHPHIKVLDKLVYWIALLLIIFGNFAFSTFMIPMLVTFNNISLYFIILLLAASFGIIMSVVIKDIETLQKGHHLLLLFLVPLVGLINFFIVVNISNNNPLANALNISHNPWIIGIIYLIGFLIPYSYLVFDKR